MGSQRDKIRMTDQELDEFLAEPHKVSLATIGADGMPHLVTMYYAMWEGRLAFWTYASSQKAKNLARDPRCSVLVEAGDGYENLRGVMMSGTVEILEDPDAVLPIGQAVYGRYVDFDVTEGFMLDFLKDQAVKRNAYLVNATDVATWNHQKLGTDHGGS